MNLVWAHLRKTARAIWAVPRFSCEARQIEYEFIKSNLPSEAGLSVLDVGCAATTLPTELRDLGYEVYGVDVLPVKSDKEVGLVIADIQRLPFLDDTFDAVTAVSTIEHVGLGRYGDPICENGDILAMREIKRILRPGGRVIATVPYGGSGICVARSGVPLHRVYSREALKRLTDGFSFLELAFIVKKGVFWMPASAVEAERQAGREDSSRIGLTSIALVSAIREGL